MDKQNDVIANVSVNEDEIFEYMKSNIPHDILYKITNMVDELYKQPYRLHFKNNVLPELLTFTNNKLLNTFEIYVIWEYLQLYNPSNEAIFRIHNEAQFESFAFWYKNVFEELYGCSLDYDSVQYKIDDIINIYSIYNYYEEDYDF